MSGPRDLATIACMCVDFLALDGGQQNVKYVYQLEPLGLQAKPIIMIVNAIIMAPASAVVTTSTCSPWFAIIPASAQMTTKQYAISFLVPNIASVIINATTITSTAQVVGLMPRPSQFTETKAADTFAVEAMVIQPR